MMQRIGCCVLVLSVLLGVAAGICSAGDVLINEIAWAGTAASANDEWIELRNTTNADIDLTGWILRFDMDSTVVHLGAVEGDTVELRRTVIEAGGYFLLERTDDTTVSDVEADLLYKGTLSNAGMLLELIDSDGTVVDSVDGSADGWPAGLSTDEANPYSTMERWIPEQSPSQPRWATCLRTYAHGLDAEGNGLAGTPRAENARSIIAALLPRVEWITSFDDRVSGIVVLQWSAVDPNGPDEQIQISIALYSNSGEQADTIVDNLVNVGSYAWDTTAWPDGEYELVLGVLDSEGLASSVASGLFRIDNAP